MTLEPLYSIDVTCYNCEHKFTSSRVRPSYKKAIRTDSDFCSYYKNENPDFYVVRVCPECGFASTENSLERLNDTQKKDFREKIGNRWIKRDFGGKRNWDVALETYKLALLCAQTIGDTERIVASILHHISWLHRYKGDELQERRFLTYCLESYIRVYELEGVGANNARLLYLIGELNRRIGEFTNAVKWFARVINDKNIIDSAMIRASREQWAVLREQMIAKQMELPGEMNPA
ncbi:DUF2225 domain-containing protein [Paenibacillus pini]|uniref:DUF2225 domain-containing protein n=1 Tax=Paenibacillus pini TaxID=669461 RepID=UPI000A45E36F|nr:DUF2225 domain-containing protein [Paenibacillus pini]